MHFAEYIIFVNMKMIYLRWSILLFTLAMSLTSVEANPPLNPLPELFIKKGCTLQTSKKRDHFNFSLDFSDLVKSYSRKTSRDPLLSRLSGAPGQTDYTSPYPDRQIVLSINSLFKYLFLTLFPTHYFW